MVTLTIGSVNVYDLDTVYSMTDFLEFPF